MPRIPEITDWSSSSESSSSDVGGEKPFRDWWCCQFNREEDHLPCADHELQALIAQRDSINASIEEQMRSHNMELPLVTDPTSKVELSFMVPAVEKQWRTEGCAEQIVLGSLFLASCELLLRTKSLCRTVVAGCGMVGLQKSAALRVEMAYNILNLIILVPLALVNVRWKNKSLHLFLICLAYLDRLITALPFLHFACGRERPKNVFACDTFPSDLDCQSMVYDRFHVQMLSVMAQVVLLPEYRYCSYMWIWIFVTTLVSSTFVVDEHIRTQQTHQMDSDDAKNEFFVRLLLLSLVQMVANRKKCTMEEQNRSLFLTNNKNKKVSQSMFKILEFMVPRFVILPMLQHSQRASASLKKLSYRFDCASVLFIAFADFDEIVQQSTPPEILQYLNQFYNRFDVMCANKRVTKIETVAEEYVCAVGVEPGSECESPQDALCTLISFAREVLDYEDASFKMGIHTGPVVAGVIGNKLPRYRLFGNTVNMAARMMQKGQAGELQFGEETRKLLPKWIQVKYRGEVEMKGKGSVKVYLLDHQGTRKSCASVPMSKGPLKTTKELYQALLAGKRAAEGGFSASSSEFNDMLRDVFRDTSATATCWKRSLYLVCPGWGSFPRDLEQEYRYWYLHTVFADNFSALRLQRQAMFLLILTGVETGYMLFMSSGFYSVPQCVYGLQKLRLYFALRAAAILLSLSMACFCPSMLAAARQEWSHPRGRRFWPIHVVSQAGHFLFVSILMLSYFLLPAYANQGGMTSVPDNVVALMTLPVYAAVMMSYQQEFLTSVAYIAAFAVMLIVIAEIPSTEANGYPSGGITFLGYSMIFALKAYMGERSLRDQFKARHAINDCKVHIEGILETLMPQRVIDELQRIAPTVSGSAAPSHQYYRATLVQSDLIGFTSMASSKPPEEVVSVVSDLFGMFDELADAYGIYKVETVGDAYIAGQAEAPLTDENYPPSVITFGLKMVKATKRWSMSADEPIALRVGVHSGECIGGIVGIDMQRYHLFGKLMHQLEILESTAPRNGLQVSQSCKLAMEQAWACDSRRARPSPPGAYSFDFAERPEPFLTTSKGEIHQYAEVGGRTYMVQAIGSEACEALE